MVTLAESSPHGTRLPTFVIIGTMKSGTTTLFRWLDTHPDVQLPRIKEPNFFSSDDRWRLGVGWYAGLFDGVSAGVRTGEASVSYTDPRLAPTAARRLRETIPTARLVCLFRDPAERMRSHYRHEVQRGHERQPFEVAIAEADNIYVRRSCYRQAIDPWVAEFPPEQLFVTSFESMTGDHDEWSRLLGFLDLTSVPRPDDVHNATADKDAFSPLMTRLWDAGLVQRAPRPPRLARAALRRALLRPSGTAGSSRPSPTTDLPADVLEQITSEVARLADLFPGVARPWGYLD